MLSVGMYRSNRQFDSNRQESIESISSQPFFHKAKSLSALSSVESPSETKLPIKLTRSCGSSKNDKPNTDSNILSLFKECIKEYESLSSIEGPDLHKLNFMEEPKNRYNNVIPIENTRVKINTNQYINANYVEYKDHKYIATQAPMNNTINDFWTMIWENNTEIIVMLCNLYEGSKQKCSKYWPSDENEKEYGKIIVKLTQLIECDNNVIIRVFDVKEKVENNIVNSLLSDYLSTRTVYQIHYRTWPDFGVPENKNDFLNLINVYKDYQSKKTLNGYDVIHCSAGIGRTGCFICMDIAIDNEEETNTLNIVKHIRNYRKGFIQHQNQYTFVYELIKDLNESRNNGTFSVSRGEAIASVPNEECMEDKCLNVYLTHSL